MFRKRSFEIFNRSTKYEYRKKTMIISYFLCVNNDKHGRYSATHHRQNSLYCVYGKMSNPVLQQSVIKKKPGHNPYQRL